MPTTQSEDPNEKVDHPRHYNQHKSGIETIELIEHLPHNLGAAVKYIWRCGLKQSETPLRDLRSARWYTEREVQRIDLYDLDVDDPPRTDIIWRSLARKVIATDSAGSLGRYLSYLLEKKLNYMLIVLDQAIEELEAKTR